MRMRNMMKTKNMMMNRALKETFGVYKSADGVLIGIPDRPSLKPSMMG